ncbi:MAG TPA: glycoside hydrolase family 31 protein, partial [Polyangiaceae bacterium]|nr:glycoside hydrolase family 31 protein [Polyangiaceae bacterium]
SRGLFSSSTAGLLSAARHALAVDEHQGSFDVREKDLAVCTGAKLTRVGEAAGGLRLEGAFTGGGPACAALRFTAELCEAREGHLAFDISLSDAAFGAIDLLVASEPDERIYGLGEQFPHDSLDLKGRRIRVLAQEGGVGRGHQPISSGVDLASHGSAGSEESTYYAAPHVLTSKLRSFFLENDELSVFDFTAPERTRARVYSARMRGRVLYGASPLELVERFTDYAGRMPPLPAWAGQGAIVALARPLDEGLAAVTRMRAAGVEISAVWNQTWSGKSKTFVGEQVLWNWAYNPAYHPGWQAWVDALDRQGIKTLCYVNSMFRELPADAGRVTRDTYAEGLALGAFVQAPDGGPYKLPVTAFDVALLDLTKPTARAWMKGILKSELLDKARCSGWMADFAEALPFDAKVASGVPGATHHNQYPVEWARLNREVVEESGLLGKVLVWNRSGFTRTPGASLLVWEGDQLTTWDKYDGLVSALHGLLNGGLSGVALNHSDTGGYTSLSAGGVGYVREAEQLQRWTEMNAFTAVLRTHEGNQPGANAQVYDAGPTLAHFARMSKVYKALAFYRQALFAEAASRGYPVVRHLLLSRAQLAVAS